MHPRGFRAEVHHLEPDEGGTYRITMAGEADLVADVSHTYSVTFGELIPGRRIIQTETAENDDPAMSGEMTVTATFEVMADGTELTVSLEVREDWPDDAICGWEAALENLAVHSLTISRVFDAPPERVYAAFLDPDELTEWLPPNGFSAEVHHLEPEEGGTFRITFTGETEELAEYGSTFGGTYHELVPGERIVHTDAFETDDPAMAGEMTITVTFKAIDGGTEVTVRQEGIPEPITVDDARAGWTDSPDQLDRLLGSV